MDTIVANSYLGEDHGYKLHDSLTKTRFRETVLAIGNVVHTQNSYHLQSHHHLLDYAIGLQLKLKNSKNQTRQLTRVQDFSQNSELQSILLDRERDIEACVQLMLMVDCQIPFAGFKIDGYQPTKWDNFESLSAFLTRSFPGDRKEDHLQLRTLRGTSMRLKCGN